MNNHTYTSLYICQAKGVDWDVLHLYEHLLLESFEQLLEKQGYSRISYGWVSGETFDGVVFVEAGFYNQKVQQLFHEFMTSPVSRINYNLIDITLESIQAEERSVLENYNEVAVKELLVELDAKPLVSVEQITDIQIIPVHSGAEKSLIKFNESTDVFQDFRVVMSLADGNLENSAVFLRLTPLIFQAITAYVRSKGGYLYETTDGPAHNMAHHSLYEIGTYGIKKGAFLPELFKGELEQAVRTYEPLRDALAITQYAQTFATMPQWHTFPIDYFRRTGYIVSRKKIAELFTPERVAEVLKAVKITIE